MLASDFVGVFSSIEKLQKNLEYIDDERAGAWLLYDSDRRSLVVMGITGCALFWEEVELIGVATSAFAEVLRSRLEEDSQLDKESRCFPCRIQRGEADYFVAIAKSKKRNSSTGIFLMDFSRNGDKVKLAFCGLRTESAKIVECVATTEHAVSMEENIYNYFVKRSGLFAPMNTHGAEFMVNPFYAKLCMDLLVSRVGAKHKHKAVQVTHYGKINDENGRKSIAANHLEISAYAPDDYADDRVPIRGIILMLMHPGGIEGRPWYPFSDRQD